MHKMRDQISCSPRLSTKSQLIYFQLKKLRLNTIFKKDFAAKSINFFKKKIFFNNFDKKTINMNKKNLDKFVIALKKNRKLVQYYFLKSNKEFLKINKTHESIEKFYL